MCNGKRPTNAVVEDDVVANLQQIILSQLGSRVDRNVPPYFHSHTLKI
jgi:hypothetical protein